MLEPRSSLIIEAVPFSSTFAPPVASSNFRDVSATATSPIWANFTSWPAVALFTVIEPKPFASLLATITAWVISRAAALVRAKVPSLIKLIPAFAFTVFLVTVSVFASSNLTWLIAPPAPIEETVASPFTDKKPLLALVVVTSPIMLEPSYSSKVLSTALVLARSTVVEWIVLSAINLNVVAAFAISPLKLTAKNLFSAVPTFAWIS